MGNLLSGEQERLILVRNELSAAYLTNPDILQRAPSNVPFSAPLSVRAGGKAKALSATLCFSKGKLWCRLRDSNT